MPFLSMDENEWGRKEIEWKPLDPTIPKKPSKKVVLPAYDPVYELVIEWYENLGIPVPPDELEALGKPLDPLPVLETPAESQETDGPTGPRPEYGTKEFWKWYAVNKKFFEEKKLQQQQEKEAKAKAKAEKDAEKKKAALEKLRAKEEKAKEKEEKALAKKLAKVKV